MRWWREMSIYSSSKGNEESSHQHFEWMTSLPSKYVIYLSEGCYTDGLVMDFSLHQLYLWVNHKPCILVLDRYASRHKPNKNCNQLGNKTCIYPKFSYWFGTWFLLICEAYLSSSKTHGFIISINELFLKKEKTQSLKKQIILSLVFLFDVHLWKRKSIWISFNFFLQIQFDFLK